MFVIFLRIALIVPTMTDHSPPPERIKTISEDDSKCTITCLPLEMMLAIALRVASQSLAGLFRLKSTCKEMSNVTEDKCIYKNVTLDTISSLTRPQNPEQASFLTRCKESGNLEFQYRQGMVTFFMKDSKFYEKGLNDLCMAARQGHKKSMYVFAMLVLSGNVKSTEHSRTELFRMALGYLRVLRKQKCVLRCRNDVQEFASKLKWDLRYGIVQVPRTRLCTDVPCAKTWRLKTPGRWYFTDEDDDDENNPNLCENCRWDHELKVFYTMIN